VTKATKNLDAIFYPRSIAVVGASTKPGSVGNDVVKNLVLRETHKFDGEVYPVNIKAKEILGIPAVKSISDIPGEVDLAVIVVPAKFAEAAIDEALAKGVKGFVVISAGFKETGSEGAAVEKKIAAKIQAAGAALIGPNCLGFINTDPKSLINASFASKMPCEGKLGFVSQSGALCTSVLDIAEEMEMGFSKFASLGNKSDVTEVDFLNYLADDPKTSVIAMYLEDVVDGTAFREAAARVFWETGKPILILKSGRSAEGAKAVSSHTGSLAGSDEVYTALFAQSGVLRVDSISELFDYASLLTTQPLPKGKRLGIVTCAGGPGIMATDAAIAAGMELATLTDATVKKLADDPCIPHTASLHNPVDIIGDAKSDRYEAAVRTVLEDPNVDLGLVILTPQSMTDVDRIGEIIPEAAKGIDKPVVCTFMGAADVAEGVKNLRHGGVPNYAFPEDAIAALAAAVKVTEIRDMRDRDVPTFSNLKTDVVKKLVAEILADVKEGEEKYLTQAECRPIFQAYGLPLLVSEVATSEEEAAKIAADINAPVVLKVMSDEVKHKFDAGGVLLNVNGADEAKAAYNQIYANVEKAVPGAKIDSILIEQMAPKGVEVILGCSHSPGFGPLMMFGLGGTLVEVLKDVTFRLAPMWKACAAKMVRSIRSFEVLNGFRGTPKSDLAAVEDILLRLSQLTIDIPEITELDINPLIVHPEGEGASVADSRIVLKK